MAPNLSAFPPNTLAAQLLAAGEPSRAARRGIGQGEAVFRQGDPATAVFLLESGRVRLARMLADGSAVILQVAESGDSFAEASLSVSQYHCDAVAEADSIVWALPKADLLAKLAREPAECLALAMVLATHVRNLRARLALRDIRSAPARLLGWLRLHAAGDPPVVPVRRSWMLVAEELGLTREAVYRALATLERQGCIRRDGHTVHLFARAGL
ncbi:MAG: Crp/Fnr family transcriptional regulator [Rhodospirillales bacterium]|nr:Crp/Fnr family transcriptional regulator [Rhodospirillales bacterium]